MAQGSKVLAGLMVVTLVALATALSVAVLPDEPAMPPPLGKGVVVEDVLEGSTLDQAGVRPGDILRAWARLPNPPTYRRGASGHIESIVDWVRLEYEEAPRGAIRLYGERDGRRVSFEISPVFGYARVRPQFSAKALAKYLEGLESYAIDGMEPTLRFWEGAADVTSEGEWSDRWWLWMELGKAAATDPQTRSEALGYFQRALGAGGEPLAVALAWGEIGELHQEEGSFKAAQHAYESALKTVQEGGATGLLILGDLFTDLSNLFWVQDLLELTEDYDQKAFEIRSTLAPNSLRHGWSLTNIGVTAQRYGQLAEAESHLLQALSIMRRLSRGTGNEAAVLRNLGKVFTDRGELSKAEEVLRQALAIRRKTDPGGANEASALESLAHVALLRGDFEVSERRYEEALHILQGISPESLEVAGLLGRLGLVYQASGDLDQAENVIRRSLEIHERLLPGSLSEAVILRHLGNLALKRGSVERSLDYHLQALDILERMIPKSLVLSESLNDLGTLALEQGEIQKAAELHDRALEIQKSQAPDSLQLAASLDRLGSLALESGDLRKAAERYHRAFEIRLERAPHGLETALSLQHLGDLAAAEGKFSEALLWFQGALGIRKALTSGSAEEAETIYSLGEVYRKTGHREVALRHFLAAIEAADAQMGRAGGSHLVQAVFRNKFDRYHRRAIEGLLELGRPEEALRMLEASRAQSFLSRLAERDLLFTLGIDPTLALKQRKLAADYDRTQIDLDALDRARDIEQVEALRRRLRRLREDLDRVATEIRNSSSRLDPAQGPKPLDLQGIQGTLDPGTVLLAYSVGEQRTDLFSITAEGHFAVTPLPVGEEDLRERVKSFRDAIGRAVPGDQTGAYRSMIALAKDLCQTLIAPAEETVAGGARLLILPDGPLHFLPWAALIRNSDKVDSGWQYMIEWKPLHISLSATVYAELKRHRRGDSEPFNHFQIVAFGDPQFPATLAPGDPDVIAHGSVRSAVERGLFQWRRLPFSRAEVESIAALFTPGSVRTYLGKEATEEAAKSVGRDTSWRHSHARRIVHFATHGYLDDHFPLNSALVLSIPEQLEEGRDNGLLQVWEILDTRMDADLVVLSACGSALGKELGGEGVIGLTRAFQHAGARSVVASLWSVRDQVTAELMLGFYDHLRNGLSKDRALQAAQIDLLRNSNGGKDRSSPYFWSAFQIHGDWQ